MRLRSLNDEILPRNTGWYDFWTNSGIARLKRAVFQARPVAPDGSIKNLGPFGIDDVVKLIHPFHVRPKARLATEVEREMDAEAARNGNGVDQFRKRRA